MKNTFKYLGVVIVVFITLFLILTFNNNIGILKSGIEKDARISHKIAEDWTVTKSTTNNTSAMIFYNGNIDNHIFSIYRNTKGLSFGYFFRSGGSISENIGLYQLDETEEKVYLSMNKQQVVRAEINKGDALEILEIDKEKPFTLVLPSNSGAVIFYDINNEVVQPTLETL